MTHQAAMTPGPCRIWHRFYLAGATPRAINAAPWHDALAQKRPVGTCECGGLLAPEQPYTVDKVTWYPARCIGHGDQGCGRQPAAAGPRPKPKPKARGKPVE